jgi:hypothetical protein
MPRARNAAPPRLEVVATIGGVRLRRRRGEKAFFFVAGMTIDADGAPRAYHPNGSPPGLDHLANAGEPGNWWALVTDARGRPIVQRQGDPAPGFYVTATALEDRSKPVRDPRRYVDSAKVPYVVLPSRALERTGARLGDFAVAWNRRTDKRSFAILADIGPAGRIGEGSMALARRLGIPHSPKTGGQNGDLVYVIFASSGSRKPRPLAEIRSGSAAEFEAWGGVARLHTIG